MKLRALAWIRKRIQGLDFSARCLGFALLISWICEPVGSLVFTDGDIAVLVVDQHGGTNSSCVVHQARHGMFLSQFLEAWNISEVTEISTKAVNKMAADCSRDLPDAMFESHRVKKRSIFNIFRGIYPGTKWCGVGNIAENNTDLGFYNETDWCCRQHDSCAHYIPARKEKYGVLNDSPFTVSSCVCDAKFLDCLHAVDSFTSRAIEFFFFHLGDLKCVTAVRTPTRAGNQTRRAVLVPVRALASPRRKPQRSSRGWLWT